MIGDEALNDFRDEDLVPAFVLFIVVTVFPPLPFNVTEIGGAGLENVEWSILLCLMLLHIVDSYDMY